MSGKQDEPPAYGQSNPQAPQAAYYPPQPGPYGQPQGPPPDNSGHYQPGPQMGYGQQPYPPQQGYHPQGGYPPQGGYYQPQGQYRDNRRSGPGFFEACLAGLACCCCLDLLF